MKFIELSNTIISLVGLLCKILSLCIVNGEFPDDMKTAKVISIYRRGDPLECSNYRPISLLSNFNKIFEKVIFQRPYSFLTKNNLISSKQFDFQQNFSTNHAMSVMYDNLSKSADKGLYSCCLLLDLIKAFDTMDHKILIKKNEIFWH